MAHILKVEGNYIVIVDERNDLELLRSKKADTTFSTGMRGVVYFSSTSTDLNANGRTSEYDFNNIKDARTGAPFPTEGDFLKFLSENTAGFGDPLAVAVEEVNYAVRVDDKSTPKTVYMGKAVIGSSESDPVWQMKKIDETTGADITWADGNDNFDNIWNDRTTLTYT